MAIRRASSRVKVLGRAVTFPIGTARAYGAERNLFEISFTTLSVAVVNLPTAAPERGRLRPLTGRELL